VTRRAQHTQRLPNAAVGLIAIVLVVVGLYLAWTKELPWSGGYEVKAVFKDAQNLRSNSPVRIAGVNVGVVREVEPLPGDGAAVVTMRIEDDGRPIHEDARLQLRPRLFLEGNLFVDVHPGSPSSPEADDGHRFPIQQTSNSVQLDQILTSLQADVRGNLQVLLKTVGNSFERYGGAEGLRTLYVSGGPAFKNTSYVSEAMLGTEPHDLSGLVKNFDKVAVGLARHRANLKDLVTNARIVFGAFAAEDEALRVAVHELPGVLAAADPVFANLNASYPAVGAFAREATPGVRTAAPAIVEATPLIRQLRGLASKPELRGLTKDLRPSVPELASLARRTIPFMEEARALSSCFTHTIIPWATSSVPDPFEPAVGPIYKETGYALTGLGGISRSGDANGQWTRVLPGGGSNTVVFPPTVTGATKLIGSSSFEINGTIPSITSSAKTPFTPDAPCEDQEPPHRGAKVGQPPETQIPASGSPGQGAIGDIQQIGASLVRRYQDVLAAESASEQKEAGEDLLQFNRNQMPDFGSALEEIRRGLP
jgi:phospholipid/cholesterol/gamma-HCH transport system substrate-binding protein